MSLLYEHNNDNPIMHVTLSVWENDVLTWMSKAILTLIDVKFTLHQGTSLMIHMVENDFTV